MKQRIETALVAKRHSTSMRLVSQVQALLGEYIEIGRFSLEEGLEPLSQKNVSLVLISTASLTTDVATYVKTSAEILIIRRTIRKESWKKILQIPPGTHAMLVNDDRDSTLETIAMLYELGAKHLTLQPYYPGLPVVPPLVIAITAGEVQLVPPTVQRIIDIGDRVIDGGTLADILSKLNLFDEKAYQKLSAYLEDTIPRSPALLMSLAWLTDVESQRDVLFDLVRVGIILLDEQRKIRALNKTAQEMLGIKDWDALGKPAEDVLFPLSQRYPLGSEYLWRREDREFIIRSAEIMKDGRAHGGAITLEDITELRDLESRLRGQLKSSGHVARYSFSHLIGGSKPFLQSVGKAKKLACGDASILLLGESGTGKELLAHAIHDHSNRRDFPFVAVNCAALPESLLESELFGYEEGAFTGARRGGKPGLFEQAHKGTIFLDEVGDMSSGVQARLLRVIQEREVLRVGATRIRHVDVRIIAAANRNLRDMVAEGLFRADLYHRLNVLPIRIPPLRERKEDIPALVDYFLATLKVRKKLADGLIEWMARYDWPGNVRELENCVRYMVAVSDGPVLTLDHLPDDVKNLFSQPPDGGHEGTSVLKGLGEPAEAVFVLNELYKARTALRKVGRRSLSQIALAAGLPLSDDDVRTLLNKLAADGLARMKRGRGGTQITEAGIALLREVRRSSSLGGRGG